MSKKTAYLSFLLLLVFALFSACSPKNKGEDSNRGKLSDVGADGRIAPLLDGMGDLSHPVSTTNTLAQTYFNQGLICEFI